MALYHMNGGNRQGRIMEETNDCLRGRKRKSPWQLKMPEARKYEAEGAASQNSLTLY